VLAGETVLVPFRGFSAFRPMFCGWIVSLRDHVLVPFRGFSAFRQAHTTLAERAYDRVLVPFRGFSAFRPVDATVVRTTRTGLSPLPRIQCLSALRPGQLTPPIAPGLSPLPRIQCLSATDSDRGNDGVLFAS